MIWHNPGKTKFLASNKLCIKTLDMHTGGEPVRIVLDGYPRLNGSILHIRRQLMNEYDHLRKALMWEPRGHRDMYGLIPVPAERKNSHLGVIFMHNQGYSTMCGHATLALAQCAVDMEWINRKKEITEINIDAPCGQIKAFIKDDGKSSDKISFENVPSFVLDLDCELELDGVGKVKFDLAYGGAFYAYFDSSQFGLEVKPENASKFVQLGKFLKRIVIENNFKIQHPFESELSFLYGVIFTQDLQDNDFYSRNACVFANGELDRSPTGSGVSGRAAILYQRNQLKKNQKIQIKSIIGSKMYVEIVNTSRYGQYDAIVPRVYGQSFYTGLHEFWIDPLDPFKEGFLI